MNLSEILVSQYQASLEMLKQTITRCPEPLWNSPGDKTKFWHIAYHTLLYPSLSARLGASFHALDQASKRISVPRAAPVAAPCATSNR